MRPSASFIAPAEMLAQAESEMEGIPNEYLFNDPAHQKLKERWCAGMFGVGYGKHVATCQVAVNEDRYREDVDFFLRAREANWEFQLAEVQEPGRRRGHEYRQIAKDGPRLFPYEPSRGRQEGPQWLADAAQKKASKRYASSRTLNLLLYANFQAGELQHSDIVASLSRYQVQFASLWVVTSLHVCSVFSDPGLGSVPGWGPSRDVRDYYM
jgi:hypothetical protein